MNEPTYHEEKYVELYKTLAGQLKINCEENSDDSFELGVLEGKRIVLEGITRCMASEIIGWNYNWFVGVEDD